MVVANPLILSVFRDGQLLAQRDFGTGIIKIGKNAAAHLVIDDERLGNVHTVLQVSERGTMTVVDMGSPAGTFVNGRRVTKSFVKVGDEIGLGDAVQVKITSTATSSVSGQGSQPSASRPGFVVAQASSPGMSRPSQPMVRAEPVSNPFFSQPTMVSSQVTSRPSQQQASGAVSGVQAVAHASQPLIRASQPPLARPSMPVPTPSMLRWNELHKGDNALQRRDAAEPSTGPKGLELRFLWGDQNVGEYFIRPNVTRAFVVGSSGDVDFEMGEKKIGANRFELVRAKQGRFQVRIPSQVTQGELRRAAQGDKSVPLSVALKSATTEDGVRVIALEDDDFLWIDLGGIVVEFFFQAPPKKVFVPLVDALDFTVLNIFLLCFFLATIFVITATNRDAEGETFGDDVIASQARIAKFITPPKIDKPPNTDMFDKKKDDSGEAAQKGKGDEGQMGRKDAPARSAKSAPKGDPTNKDQARTMVSKVFGGSGGISTVFGHKGLGGELRGAIGNLVGTTTGDAAGLGGMGLRGSGAGGGGLGDTVGIGGIATRGRGGGNSGFGANVGVLGRKRSPDIEIKSDDVGVQGALDKELIRRVIHANRGQIRYCYDAQLNRFPNLNGKVSIKFTITPEGTVLKSNVVQSTVGNAEMESCVADRVLTWLFPKPKGGGVVIVTYPFIFKPAGQ